MRIIFDLRKVGLGNNGGSSTLVHSGNTLVKLGCDVTFIDSFKNQHTWNKLKADHIIPHDDSDIPGADIIIATGYKSVATTLKSSKRLGTKCHWIRGWETWQMPERQIIKDVLNVSTVKLVNSICLKRKLKSYGFDSEIVRPGYDLNLIKPSAKFPRAGRKRIILGGLYSIGKHWNIKRTQWIFDVYDSLKNKYDIELWMFGNTTIDPGRVDNYIQRPSMKEKNIFFNSIDVWLSPAMQEGLHMPPAEAMMAGCPVVGTNADMSGTEDYLIHEHTGLVAENNFYSFLENVDKIINNEKMRIFMGKRARDMIESLGTREANMSKLIEYFMGIM